MFSREFCQWWFLFHKCTSSVSSLYQIFAFFSYFSRMIRYFQVWERNRICNIRKFHKSFPWFMPHWGQAYLVTKLSIYQLVEEAFLLAARHQPICQTAIKQLSFFFRFAFLGEFSQQLEKKLLFIFLQFNSGFNEPKVAGNSASCRVMHNFATSAACTSRLSRNRLGYLT